jgi:3-hydroxyacyl-CoA dehydrogenase
MVEVTVHDKNLRDALIDHWEDLSEEAIDELLATHRIEAAKAERNRILAFLRDHDSYGAWRRAAETIESNTPES